MFTTKIERTIKALSKYGLVITRISANSEPPQIEIDHSCYPGIEAHLFTIADAASWKPELKQSGDVILSAELEISYKVDPWTRLFLASQTVMDGLKEYREGLKHGIISSSNWISDETKWYRANWVERQYKAVPPEEFLHLVDESIRSHIRELNELGFHTTQSCSGLLRDHEDREPYLPYVMFDERSYPRASAHLFTIADIAGWIPSYAPHQFDIELRLHDAVHADRFWNKLVVTARKISSLLDDYRSNLAKLPYSLKGAM